MKKLLFSALAIALVAAACNNNSSNSNQNNSNSQDQNTTPQTQTYSNATYGFSFEYPPTMQSVTPVYPRLQDKITQLQIPGSAYPNTNFNDAAFSVSAQFANSLTNCLALNAPENSDGFKTKVSINGVDWYKTASSGAAAGNRYDSTVYRTVKSTNGACIEIDETIHTGNIGNYPAGTVTEVDQTPIQNQLDSILNSFKFQ